MESDIKLYQKSGRNRSVEIIEPKLGIAVAVADGKLRNGGIYGLPKTRRDSRN